LKDTLEIFIRSTLPPMENGMVQFEVTIFGSI